MSRRFSGKPASVLVRLTAYLRTVLGRGVRTYPLNFDKLAKSFGCTRRAVEYAMQKLRAAPGNFIFRTVRVGSVYVATVSERNRIQDGSFSYGKKNNHNTPPAASGFKNSTSAWRTDLPPSAKILSLAAWLARHELGKAHRAKSRTMFRFAHAYNFAATSLHAGHARTDIVKAYRQALRDIDVDLAHLPQGTVWEPSSLIRLARRRLADGLNTPERVAFRRRVLRSTEKQDQSKFISRLGSLIGSRLVDDEESAWQPTWEVAA
jgi:hypothetical protein